MLRSRTILAVLAAVFVALTGCASQQTLSNYARAGDTVTVSLGGTEANAQVPVVKAENLAVTITDSAGQTYPVNVRHVFRVYPDPTSRYSIVSEYPEEFTPDYDKWVPAHQGLWMAVLDLVDPGTTTPLPILPGLATLSVSSPDLLSFVDYSHYDFPWANGRLDNIPIEILDGTGAPNPLNKMQYVSFSPATSLPPGPQVEVSISGVPAVPLGGAQFTFQYDPAGFNPQLRVVTTTGDPDVQLAANDVDAGDGTRLLHVMVTNPKGFNTHNDKVYTEEALFYGASMLRSLRFNIVWVDSDIVDDSNWQNYLMLVNSEFVDLNGAVVTGIAPLLTKVR